MESSHDPARRRKTVRRGRERGCWLYVPAEQLERAGYSLAPGSPTPWYRTWLGRKGTVLVQLYPEP